MGRSLIAAVMAIWFILISSGVAIAQDNSEGVNIDINLSLAPVYDEEEVITVAVEIIQSNSPLVEKEIQIEFVGPDDAVVNTLTATTDKYGRVIFKTVLMDEMLGEYDVIVSVADNNTTYHASDSFILKGKSCKLRGVLAIDSSIEGYIWSRDYPSKDYNVQVLIHLDGKQVLQQSKIVTSEPYEVKRWEIDYGLTLPRGSYIIQVNLWDVDYTTQIDKFMDEFVFDTIDQSTNGYWIVTNVMPSEEGYYDLTISQDWTVTNKTFEEKPSFLFRCETPFAAGTYATITRDVDYYVTVAKDGLITQSIDLDQLESVSLSVSGFMERAIRYEWIQNEDGTYTLKLTNLTDLTLKELAIDVPFDIGEVRDMGGAEYDSNGSQIKISSIPVAGTLILRITQLEIPEFIDQWIDKMLYQTVYVLPLLVWWLIGGGIFAALIGGKWWRRLIAFIIPLIVITILIAIGVL